MRVKDDPFVAEGVPNTDMLEIAATVDERLAFP
ncbi:hypothetical protein FHX15_002150 [Rhizobium sp. BK650]|nr:hypothetical protein [Rhizobium sp. BK650]